MVYLPKWNSYADRETLFNLETDACKFAKSQQVSSPLDQHPIIFFSTHSIDNLKPKNAVIF